MRLIEPKVVCTLGNFATKLLSGNPAGITRVRGTPQVHELGGRAVFLLPLFHPAAALRTPAVKETLRGDFATLPDLLAGPAAGARPPSPRRSPSSRPRALDRRRRRPTSSTSSASARGVVREHSAAETEAVGARLAERLGPGRRGRRQRRSRRRQDDPVRGACRALGVEEPVTSPTFTIGQRYRGPASPVSHLDLYRLPGLEQEDPALLDDYLTPDAIAFVEWPAAAAGRLRRAVRSRCGCAHGGGDRREIELDSAPSPRLGVFER